MTEFTENRDSENLELKEQNSQAENHKLRPGEFLLTAIQAILINKHMPKGYKLETEEMYLKSEDISRFNGRKRKATVKDINLRTL